VCWIFRAHRGRGLAPAVWSEVSEQLRAEGVEGLVTKVGLANDASRRAVMKSGFEEIGHVVVSRRNGRIRVEVREPRGRIGTQLQGELSR
jgi:L-amino acid N-acyltransferase YncA